MTEKFNNKLAQRFYEQGELFDKIKINDCKRTNQDTLCCISCLHNSHVNEPFDYERMIKEDREDVELYRRIKDERTKV